MIKKIAAYDMDGTLLHTPEPEYGIKAYEEIVGLKYPHIGWWSRPESLDYNIFDIKPNNNVLSRLNQDNKKSDVYTVLLTARIFKLKSNVVDLLNHLHIYLDEIKLKENTDDKAVRLEKLIPKFPDLKEIDVYDDREKEFNVLLPFKEYAKNKYGINVNVYKVDKNNIYPIYHNKSINEIKKTIDKVINEIYINHGIYK